MKFLTLVLSCTMFLYGCGSNTAEMNAAMDLREKMLTQSCIFTAEVTADYTDDLYCFHMECETDSTGTLTFTVMEPTSIAGITGKISADDAKLIFDDTVLLFPVLADGSISPVAAPWVLINTLRSGYLSACGKEGDGLRILANDSYEDNALQLEILTNADAVPIQADIFWKGQRILCLTISNFVIL